MGHSPLKSHILHRATQVHLKSKENYSCKIIEGCNKEYNPHFKQHTTIVDIKRR